MRINSKYIYGLLGVSLALAGCSSEELTSPSEDTNGETVLVTLTVDRSNAKTRTTISETEAADGTGLSNVWEKGDQVTLVSKSGVVGTLTLEGDGGDSEGVFSGELAIANGEYDVWYLGATPAYASFAEGATKPSNDLSNKGWSVSGDFADLNKGDLMTSTVQIVVKDGKAVAATDVNLEAQMAMAHFTLSGEGISSALEADGASLTFAYGEYSYNITNVGADVYVPMFPGACKPSFTLVSGGKTYSYAFEKETNVAAGLYYTETQGEGNGISVELALNPDNNGDDEDDLVGPAIKIGDKYYRFVRGNLYCDILDKDNYVWHLYDKETYYQLKAGTSSLYVTKTYTSYVRQINGTWKGSSNPANVNATNHYVDLFPWGATGLGTGDYKAKLPDIIRKGIASENTGTSYTGAHWPSDVTNTMDVNGNANILNLWEGYSFEDPVYDFGYAYMQNGRPAEDTRTFVTAPLEAYAYICDPKRSFSQGCVVKGAGYDGTSDAQGALILYGITTIEDAKAVIEAVGGITKTGFNALTPNKPKSGFTYLIELPNYNSLQALNEVKEINGKTVNIQALFFASGGNGVYNFSNGIVNLNETDGAYWTSNGVKGSSTTANAYGFYFRNTSSATEFCWKSDASGVSSKRNTQRSVRLMVEVPNPNAPIVVD